jgi:hypothetical protein
MALRLTRFAQAPPIQLFMLREPRRRGSSAEASLSKQAEPPGG